MTHRCLLLALPCILAGCAASTTTDTHDRDDAGAWISMIDNDSLEGWTPKFAGLPLGENDRDTFRVEDGVMKVVYDERWTSFDGAFGHLFYAHAFEEYTLVFEYRFVGEQVPGAPGWAFKNSGVMLHGQPARTMELDQSFPISLEMQLLGGDGTNPRPTGNLCTPGTNVVMNGAQAPGHCINSESMTFHDDQWIAAEIEVTRDVIRHMINGRVVMEYSTPTLDPNDARAAAWIEQRGGNMTLTGGSISLQAESHPIEFRNMKIRAH